MSHGLPGDTNTTSPQANFEEPGHNGFKMASLRFYKSLLLSGYYSSLASWLPTVHAATSDLPYTYRYRKKIILVGFLSFFPFFLKFTTIFNPTYPKNYRFDV